MTPVSVDDVLTVSEDSSSVLVDVLANDSDVDQDKDVSSASRPPLRGR